MTRAALRQSIRRGYLRRFVRLFCVEAARALLRHKGRSSLAAIGITVGIALVVWVIAIGRAGARRSEEQFHNLGDNLVWVEAGGRSANGVRTGTHDTTSLTMADAEAILREISLVKSASPNVDGRVQVIRGNRNWNTSFRGVSPEFLPIKRWRIAEGEAFTDEELQEVASVCVIGETVRAQLFGHEDAVGQSIRVQGTPFQIIGVLAPKGQSATGQDQDDTILMPYTTAVNRLRGKGYAWLDDIMCSAASEQGLDGAIERIVALLRQRHHVGPGTGQEDDFNIRRPDLLIKSEIEAARTLALFLLAVALISVLVGGIGIMNVMLASVSQRTQEIGLRLAVGATEREVQLQFLGEAVLLSVFGGLCGFLLSIAGAFVVERFVGWPLAIPSDAVGLAIFFSAANGVLFGFYPAWRCVAHGSHPGAPPRMKQSDRDAGQADSEGQCRGGTEPLFAGPWLPNYLKFW